MKLTFTKPDPLQLIKFLSVVIYVLILFDGALRKWIVPQLSGPLFFVKDIFVIYIYFLSFKHKLFPRGSRAILMGTLLFVLLGLAQCIFGGVPLAVVLIGVRNYFLLLPLTWIIANIYTWDDVRRIVKLHCLLGIPIAAIVFLQSASPPSAFINKGTGMGEGEIFTVVKGVVRTYGPFSFIDGQTLYVNFLFTGVLFMLMLPNRNQGFKLWITGLIAMCAVLCMAVSGSRSVIANLLILITIVLGATVINASNKKALKYYSVLIGGAMMIGLLATTIFAENVQHLQERFTVASRAENTTERFFKPFTGVIHYLGETTVLGAGLGASSGAGAKLMTGKAGFTLAEGEWENILLESGMLFGLAYLLFRIGLFLLIIVWSYRSYMRTNQILPVILAAGVAFLLLQGQLIRGGTPMYFCWFFVGLALAMIRINNEEGLPRAVPVQ